jgi:protein subunit release factor B
MREKLFSVSAKDCRMDTFRAGGKGGQNQNKVESGVRFVHPPSGAVGEARDSRDQLQNRRSAFLRMAQSRLFQSWCRTKAAELRTGKTIDQIVDESITPETVKVEILGSDGRWTESTALMCE